MPDAVPASLPATRAATHRLEQAGHYVVEDAWEEILPLIDA